MYKSRELKSVALPETEAVSLKLRLHKPHSNAHNVYQQVQEESLYESSRATGSTYCK